MSAADCPTLGNLDEQSTAFVFESIDLGMEYAKLDADGFAPLAVILGEDGSKEIWKLVGDGDGSWSVEDGVALGRQKLRELDGDAHCATLVYDGYFTDDGSRTEAVFIEAYELGRPAGVRMCQRYERRGGEVALIGNPLLFDDEAEPLVPEDRPVAELPNLGPESKRFALDAITIGIEQVEPEASLMIPFAAVLGGDDSRDLWRLIDDEDDPTVGGGLDLGREQLRSVDPASRCVALVWGGDIPDDADQEGAVFVECYELGRPAGVRLVQPYRRIDHDRIGRLGETLVLEEAEPLVPQVESGRAAAIARIQAMADKQRG